MVELYEAMDVLLLVTENMNEITLKQNIVTFDSK